MARNRAKQIGKKEPAKKDPAKKEECRNLRTPRMGPRDAAEVLEYARSGQQNAILLDTDLPDMTISEAVIALRHSQPKLPICVFSRRVDPEQRARLMRLGANKRMALLLSSY